MNNENANLEPVQENVGIPEVGATNPATDAPSFQTIDPTADFQTIDPTATEATVPISEPAPVVEEAVPATSMEEAPKAEEPAPLEATVPVAESTTSAEDTGAPTSPAVVQGPRANPVDMSSFEADKARYNPVTGEEMDVNSLVNGGDGKIDPDAINNEEKLKTVEVEYKPSGKGNTVLMIFFFIGLILFVVFLPDITEMIALRRAGDTGPKEILSGTMTCKLDSNTVNLDRSITRKFEFTDKKLQKAKFVTITRGDPTLDEEALDAFNEQCTKIRDNVESLEGIEVSCDYKEGKLTESETFTYSVYDLENVSAAYTEAGGSVLEFEYEEDIDKVMKLMLQGGFDCVKK